MFKEFREFAMKGNVVDMAVGVMVGAAFGKIVTSLVTDIITPPLGLLMGKLDFSNLFISLNGRTYHTLAEARQAGAATVNLGLFINSIIDFLLVAFVLFLIIRQINRMRREPVAATMPTRECPHCISTISGRATRCPNCTAELGAMGSDK